MGIESGPGGRGPEMPRTLEAKIEGKAETTFGEIDPDDATHIPLFDIAWKNAQLQFKEVGKYTKRGRYGISDTIQLYTAQLEYSGRQNSLYRRSNLSLTTSREKPVFFTGTREGFYAHDPLAGGKNDPFYIVGLHPYELKEKMSRMSAIWHELGHIAIYHANQDTQLLRAAVSLNGNDLPEVAKADTYALDLADALPYGTKDRYPLDELDRHALFQLRGRSHATERATSLFSERYAWAAGMHLVRANEYPTGFKKPQSYFDYARLCLDSYARYYRDEKFVKGWK